MFVMHRDASDLGPKDAGDTFRRNPAGRDRLAAHYLLSDLPTVVYACDAEGRLTFYNDAAADLWGQRPKLGIKEWPGTSRPLRGDGTAIAPGECPLAQALMTQRTVEDVHIIVERHGMGQSHWLASAKPVFDTGGKLAGVINMLTAMNGRESTEQPHEGEAHLRDGMEVNPAIFWTADPQGRLTLASDLDAERLGLMTRPTSIARYLSLVHPDDRQSVRAAIAASRNSGEPIDSTCRLLIRGRYYWVRTRAHARRDKSGRILAWHGLSEDIHRHKAAEEVLRIAQERLVRALDENHIGVWDWSVVSDEVWLSDRAYAIQGYTPGELASNALRLDEMLHPNDRPEFVQLLRDTLAGRIERFVSEHRLRTKSGEWVWVSDRGSVVERDANGRALRMLGTRADISERKTAEERIRWLADHDSLTELPNRRLFQNALGERLAAAGRKGERLALLLLDVDDFKQVNDTHGHDAGDMILRTFADRLRATVDTEAMIARLGGDEFAVILPSKNDVAATEKVMASILSRLREPFVHAGAVLDCRASAGAALFPIHGGDSDDLLKCADMALYDAKSRGAGSMALFAPSMRSAVEARAVMVRTAREAIHTDRVAPFYQPKVALGSGRLTGFEALLRWRDPKRGFQPPASIVAAFDDVELANDLSKRMLDRIIRDMTGWLDAGLEFGHVALNASAAEFRQGGFAERVLATLAAADIAPDRLEIEVTETVFLGRGAEFVLSALKMLSEAGVRIALDDFGTGYASLTHLKQFPVDTIKLDRSFISDLEDDPYDAAIVRAVLNLGESLGIDIVAEGIETPVQAAYLWAQGCGYGQGHLFGKPLPAVRIPQMIAAWPSHGGWRAMPSRAAV